MAEYIEREEVYREICTDSAMSGYEKAYCCELIRDIPAADVAPVLHGRWLSWEEQFPDKNPRRKNNLGVFCNKCTNHADNRTDYCPNCGARMDGDSNA